MAEEVGNLKVRIGMDSAEFQKSMTSINKNLQTLGQEFRTLQNKGKDWGTTIDGLQSKQKKLTDLFDGQKEKVQRLTEQYQKVVAEQGEHSKQAENLAYQLAKAEAEMTKTETELSQITVELQKQQAELKKSQSSWNQLGENLKAVGDKLKSVGESMTNVGKELSLKLTAPLTALGVSVVKTAADFEAQMDRVGAIAGATGEEMEKLSAKAMELGASTSKSASEVAIGMENMAAMGFTVNEIMSAMPGIISAAEASGADMAQTADVVASSLNIWNLQASEASRVADILAQTANQSAADITDMQYALKYAGPPAASLGVSLEELAASIGIMTDAGMKGEQAGTTLRSALLGLLDPSEENSKLMDKMGVAITDAEGNFVGLANLVRNLEESMYGYTDTQKAATLASLVGKEAVSGMLSLMATGPETIEQLTTSLENSAGVSKEAADKMKDNLKGALEELGGAFETLSIQLGNILIPLIRDIATFIQNLVEKFSELSPEVQTTILVITGIAAAIGPVLVATGLLISSIGTIAGAFGAVSLAIAEAGGVMALLSAKLGFLGTAFSALTGPIGITVAAIVGIGAALVVAYNKVEWFRDGVNKVFDAVKDFVETVFEGIKKTITSLISSAVDLAKDILDDFKAFWNENGKFITNMVKTYMNTIKSNIEMVLGIIKGVFQVVWPIISSVVKVAWETIKLAIKNALDLILGTITVAMKLLQGDWKGAWEAVKDIAKNIMDNIVGFFKGIDLYQIGKDIIQGLVNGIGSMINAVKNKVKSITDGIKDSITDALKINSPSKITTQYGEWTGEGLAIGMDNSLSMVKKAASGLAEITKQSLNIGDSSRGSINSYDQSRTYQPSVTIINQGGNMSPAQQARQALNAQRALAMEWGV